MKNCREEGIIEDGMTIGYLPMYHSFCMGQIWRSIVLQAPMVIMRKFNEEALLRVIQEYRVIKKN